MGRSGRRFIVVASALVAMLAVAGLGTRMVVGSVDPRSIPQERLFELGTSSATVKMTPLPAQRSVVVAPVKDAEVLRAARTYFSLRSSTRDRVQGYYDPRTRSIHIIGVLPRLEASTDVEWAQWHFRRALRHEYGHAFFDDWTSAQLDAVEPLPDYSVDRESARAGNFPRGLRPVVVEFSAADTFVFGYDYYTSSFAEYLAEGYARYLEGRPVPPRLRTFFEAASERR